MKSNPLKWHGGKSYLANWIRKHYPPRGSYNRSGKAYGGGLATLFKDDPEGVSEYVNDCDGDLMSFWSCLAHPERSQEFVRVFGVCPLSQEIFRDIRNKKMPSILAGHHVLVQRAGMLFIRYRMSRQGLGTSYATPTGRLRRGMNEQVSAWLSAVDSLPEACNRLIRVEIRNQDAVEFIQELDSEKTFYYLDPTYLHNDIDGTQIRAAQKAYKFEMSLDAHVELLSVLANLKGKFLLSGYPSKLYEQHRKKNGWFMTQREIDNKASRGKADEDGNIVKPTKVECLWRNYEETAEPLENLKCTTSQ